MDSPSKGRQAENKPPGGSFVRAALMLWCGRGAAGLRPAGRTCRMQPEKPCSRGRIRFSSGDKRMASLVGVWLAGRSHRKWRGRLSPGGRSGLCRRDPGSRRHGRRGFRRRTERQLWQLCPGDPPRRRRNSLCPSPISLCPYWSGGRGRGGPGNCRADRPGHRPASPF